MIPGWRLGEVFLPTPSARRATFTPDELKLLNQLISTHALREEGDVNRKSIRNELNYFYPRPPRGGRPGRRLKYPPRPAISTHALREEGDARRT